MKIGRYNLRKVAKGDYNTWVKSDYDDYVILLRQRVSVQYTVFLHTDNPTYRYKL